jgi:hypothetical protein
MTPGTDKPYQIKEKTVLVPLCPPQNSDRRRSMQQAQTASTAIFQAPSF